MIIAYAGRCSAYGSLGQQTLGLNDCDQALALYARRCAAYGVFAKSWNSAAADLPGLRQQTLDCDQALGLTTGLAIAHNNRGWRYLNLGQYDSAAHDFEEAER